MPTSQKFASTAIAGPVGKATLAGTGVGEGFERLTVNTAFGSVPSVTLTFETLNDGVSLSVPPAPVPSSLIVPTPVLSAIVAFTAPFSDTRYVSHTSELQSHSDLAGRLLLTTQAAKITAPDATVKSTPAVARA